MKNNEVKSRLDIAKGLGSVRGVLKFMRENTDIHESTYMQMIENLNTAVIQIENGLWGDIFER